MTVAKKRIDAYARNMFAYESLHDTWIDKCQGYLEYVFGGDSLKGATVIDYAFGRGNWSAAFIQAGAERVYSIDASQHNCDKLKGWCAKNGVKGIEISLSEMIEDIIRRPYTEGLSMKAMFCFKHARDDHIEAVILRILW